LLFVDVISGVKPGIVGTTPLFWLLGWISLAAIVVMALGDGVLGLAG